MDGGVLYRGFGMEEAGSSGLGGLVEESKLAQPTKTKGSMCTVVTMAVNDINDPRD